MNLRLLASAAATLAACAALAWACGAPSLVVPPPISNEASVPSGGPCSAVASAEIRANTGFQGDAGALTDCRGKVVTYDPSEGLCDARLGYLVCDSGCYSEFKCEIPDGYTLVQLDGAPFDSDAAEEAEAGADATPADAEVDVKPDTSPPDATSE